MIACVCQATLQRDSVLSDNRDLVITVEAMKAALSIRTARSSTLLNRPASDRTMPLAGIDVSAFAVAADAAVNSPRPSPLSKASGQPEPAAAAPASPFAGTHLQTCALRHIAVIALKRHAVVLCSCSYCFARPFIVAVSAQLHHLY